MRCHSERDLADARLALRETMLRRMTPTELGHLGWVLACSVRWGLSAADIFAVLLTVQLRFGEIAEELERREVRRRKVVPIRR